MADNDQARNVLLDELRWIHDLLRRDLATCRQLGADVALGASPTEVRTRIDELQASGGLFQLRSNCSGTVDSSTPTTATRTSCSSRR